MSYRMSDLHSQTKVRQHNDLIEACYSLSLNEKRLILIAVSKLNSRMPMPDQPIFIEVEEFQHLCGMRAKSTAFEALEEAAEALWERTINLVPIGRRQQEVDKIRWVEGVKYIKGGGHVRLEFSRKVAPFLTELTTRFTTYELRQALALSSFYSMRMYELAAQFKGTEERTVTLERLRDLLDMGDKYPRTNSFIQRVITPSVADINKHTDLKIAVKPIRRGRMVLGFSFDIKEKARKAA